MSNDDNRKYKQILQHRLPMTNNTFPSSFTEVFVYFIYDFAVQNRIQKQAELIKLLKHEGDKLNNLYIERGIKLNQYRSLYPAKKEQLKASLDAHEQQQNEYKTLLAKYTSLQNELTTLEKKGENGPENVRLEDELTNVVVKLDECRQSNGDFEQINKKLTEVEEINAQMIIEMEKLRQELSAKDQINVDLKHKLDQSLHEASSNKAKVIKLKSERDILLDDTLIFRNLEQTVLKNCAEHYNEQNESIQKAKGILHECLGDQTGDKVQCEICKKIKGKRLKNAFYSRVNLPFTAENWYRHVGVHHTKQCPFCDSKATFHEQSQQNLHYRRCCTDKLQKMDTFYWENRNRIIRANSDSSVNN